MDKSGVRGVLLCLLIVMMDFAAGILGLLSEKTLNKVQHLRLGTFECRKPSHQAYMMGLSAALLLVLAHVIVNLLYGCTCIVKTSSNGPVRVFLLLLSSGAFAIWIVLAVDGDYGKQKLTRSLWFLILSPPGLWWEELSYSCPRLYLLLHYAAVNV
ncbi:hypothetical protein E2542_SST09828 [Spatholobus suberectus]|nr:hypothetical protein E2542_SST09828 [Spatholobus suberectus]